MPHRRGTGTFLVNSGTGSFYNTGTGVSVPTDDDDDDEEEEAIDGAEGEEGLERLMGLIRLRRGRGQAR